ncbi:MAG: hypothetical protein PHQ50_02660 [Eubacteriales bacterium]|nr:hypothetical protein [Eubacteriales bacterium]
MKYYLCAALVALLLISLCSCGDKKTESAGTDKGEEALLTGELSELTSDYSLGSAVITPAEDKAASVFYSPIGGAVFLDLKDSAGNQWPLDVPENALPYGETITMRLCKSIATDVVSGKQISGVVFEPAGLQFTEPATLTVSGPAATKEACVFYADMTKQNLNFTTQEEAEKNLQILVSHFSAYVVYTPTGSSEIKQAQDLAGESYKAVLEEVKKFLKTPVTAPPIPDDYSFECDEEDGENASQTRNRELDAYIRSVVDPEFKLAGRLLGAGYQIAQLGGETDSFYFARLLLERDLKKADKLIRTYQKDNEKLIPVMNVTFKILKEMGALGMEVPNDYMGIFSDWMGRAADEQLRKIREEHDYKALSPALALVKGSAILSSDYSASQDFTKKYMEDLKKAMTFEVEYKVSVYAGIAEQKMTLEGKAEVNFLDENNENAFTGTGTGSYLSYSHTGVWTTTIDKPNEYAVKMKFVDFSPCNSENVKLSVSTIGAETEVWYNPELDERSSDAAYSFVNFIAEELYSDYAAEGGGYIFEIPFQNKNVVMGKESFTKTGTITYPEEGGANGSISYTVEIKHTPK